MIVWIPHVKVGHRQILIPNPRICGGLLFGLMLKIACNRFAVVLDN